MSDGLTVYDISKWTEPQDGLADHHIMLARGVVAEVHKTARRLTATIAEALVGDESMWDIWTHAIETYEARYDPDKGRPSTYGHYAVRHALSETLRILLKSKRGTQGHSSIRTHECPQCSTPRMHSEEIDGARIAVLSKLLTTCPDCGLEYTPVSYRPSEFVSLEGSHAVTSWDTERPAGANSTRGRETINIERDPDTGRTTQRHHETNQPLDDATLKDRNEFIGKALADLPPRTERIMRARFFDGADLRTIAKQEGLTHQRIDQIIKKTTAEMADTLANVAPGA